MAGLDERFAKENFVGKRLISVGKIDEFGDFHPLSRQEWRDWLFENHDKLSGVWLVYFKKHTKKPFVSYDEAVEEALCFGWIDSIPRKLDEDRSKLLHTPRKPKSVWSKANKERVERLIANGLMTEIGQKKIDKAKLDGSWDALNASDNLEIHEDLLRALKGNNIAFENFEKFTKGVKKSILSWIYSAKTADTRLKRIDKTISMAERNLRAQFDKE
jgi:uncharacterized protein YdeI (YjbR/CyaY-like superfamily)